MLDIAQMLIPILSCFGAILPANPTLPFDPAPEMARLAIGPDSANRQQRPTPDRIYRAGRSEMFGPSRGAAMEHPSI